eukprot:m.72800 g.72800  ORF g.72800 m.72800 type:complete len:761 (+) comp24485_c0_seq1:208-2490(+)
MSQNVSEWLAGIGVSQEQIEIANDMGLDFPIDFLLYPRDELTHFYGFKSETVDAVESALAALQVGKRMKGIEKCVALYAVKSQKSTYLNAKAGEEFAIVNSSFDWWLCRNSEGQTGFLPSNHCERVVAEDEGLYEQPLSGDFASASRTSSLYGHGRPRKSSESKRSSTVSATSDAKDAKEPKTQLVLPTWMLRTRVKNMMNDALLSDDSYFITYNTVKNSLIAEFGEETYRADIEHVKEIIRRTEEKMRTRKNEPHAAEVMIHAATRHRFRSFKRRFTPSRQTDRPDIKDVDDPELVRDIELVGSQGFGVLPSTPTSDEPIVSQQFLSKMENDWFDSSASNWTGGWVLKKGESRNFVASKMTEKRRYFVPSDSGLKYYADETLKSLKGEILLDQDMEVWFPVASGFKVMIQHDTNARIFQLTACDQRCYDNLKRYLHSVLSRKVPFVAAADLQVVTPIKSGGNFSSSVVSWKLHGTVVKKALKGIELTDKAMVKQIMMGIRELCLHKHSNIVTSLGIGCELNIPFVVQEYAERFSLRKLLFQENRNELAWTLKMQFLQDIARGMAYLHQEYNLPHLRLHGNNVLVMSDMRLKISDYGIAWAGLGYADMLAKVGGDETQTLSTAQGMETDGYVNSAWVRGMKTKACAPDNFCSAPELWNQALGVTPKHDVYSFAMILLEIITLKPADFDLKEGYNLQELHAAGMRPRVPDDCPVDGLTRLMVDCWRDTADTRPSFSKILDTVDRLSPEKKSDLILPPKGIL